MKTNKLYEKTKKFLKNNYKFLIIYGILLLLFTVRLDYEVYTPGGLSNLNKRISVDNPYESKGSLNLTYVNAKKGIIPMILLSYIIPSWDLVSIDDSRIEDEDYIDILARGKIDLKSINGNATITAFKKANMDYNIVKNDLTVYYVFNEATTNLKVGDIIKKVDDEVVSDLANFKKLISEKNVGDTVTFTVIRNNKETIKTGKIYESDDSKLIGIYLTSVLEVTTDKNVVFKYKNNESGSSGGLMSALEIYNQLTKSDITKGLTIAGTGTIDMDGNVGEIAGVKYKIMGAVKNKADVFIVPADNYEEAKQIVNKYNYKIKLIEAKNFNQVLEDLEKI